LILGLRGKTTQIKITDFEFLKTYKEQDYIEFPLQGGIKHIRAWDLNLAD
jgi:hypothetical protein